MSDSRQKSVALNINRCLIYLFSLIGLYADMKLAYLIALTLWVWLPTFTRMEIKFVSSVVKRPILKRFALNKIRI